ncbi:MAG: hypothetical protein ACI4TU_06120 [Candidatus Cryptobacteroides sp.]
MTSIYKNKEILQNTLDFAAQNCEKDTSVLLLGRDKWKDIDIDIAINCIESRKKLKGKVPQWYGNDNLVFPLKLSAEQCSSSESALYKASLAVKIASGGFRLADLTGGLGVDSWFFSKHAESILYCEMKAELCSAAEHNFAILGAGNIHVRNCMIVPSAQVPATAQTSAASKVAALSPAPALPETLSATPAEILEDFHPDIVYADPARRSESGKKVFLIEECAPDILTLKDEIFRYSPHILLKLSPMADITMVCNRLGAQCRQVHVVSVDGECKELLIWMDRQWNGGYEIVVASLGKGDCTTFCFTPQEEKTVCAGIISANGIGRIREEMDVCLFEPGKAIMKAGAFNLMSARGGMFKLGQSTHYYIGTRKQCSEYARLGKIFSIERCEKMDKRTLKEIALMYPGADITARNLPADTATYRKVIEQERRKNARKGTTDAAASQAFHIFCLKSDRAGALLIVGKRISSDVLDGEGPEQLSQD